MKVTANNRLYIRCKGCGDSMLVTESSGEPYYLDDHEVKMLNQFFHEHAYCVEDDGFPIGGRFELHDKFDDGGKA